MIRAALTSGLALAALAGAAVADTPKSAPVSAVSVAVAPALAAKVDMLDQRDLALLSSDLNRAVEQALRAKGRLAPDGVRLELTLTDAKPNRPTFTQLSRQPGLDMRSIGLGGATIDGFEVAADGARTPVHYSWYEDDLRNELGPTTWTDAETAIDRFARKYAAQADKPVR